MEQPSHFLVLYSDGEGKESAGLIPSIPLASSDLLILTTPVPLQQRKAWVGGQSWKGEQGYLPGLGGWLAPLC